MAPDICWEILGDLGRFLGCTQLLVKNWMIPGIHLEKKRSLPENVYANAKVPGGSACSATLLDGKLLFLFWSLVVRWNFSLRRFPMSKGLQFPFSGGEDIFALFFLQKAHAVFSLSVINIGIKIYFVRGIYFMADHNSSYNTGVIFLYCYRPHP